MKFAGYREVPLAKIIAPGDVAKRQKTEGVKQLVESIRKLGDEPMHALVCRKDRGSWELIAGRDRFSALRLLKADQTWVHVVAEATPLELVLAEAHENLRRRVDDPAKLLALIDQAEQQVISARANANSKAKAAVGRPQTARGEARELVAEATGRTPEAVRHLEQRAAEKRDEGEAGSRVVGASTAPPPPPIDLHGHAMPDHMMDVPSLVAQFAKVDKLLIQLKAAATDLGMFGSARPGVVERIKRAISDVTDVVRAERPAHLCPKCDGKSHNISGPFCKLCQETGWVTAAQFTAAPKKRDGVSVEEFAAGLDVEPIRVLQKLDEGNVETEAQHHARPSSECPFRGCDNHFDVEPEPGDCAHAYRKGAVPTGVCLSCGAAGAATWTDAQHMPKGNAAPPHEPEDAGWVAHGPGSDRKPAGAPAKKPRKQLRVEVDGETLTVDELERRAAETPL